MLCYGSHGHVACIGTDEYMWHVFSLVSLHLFSKSKKNYKYQLWWNYYYAQEVSVVTFRSFLLIFNFLKCSKSGRLINSCWIRRLCHKKRNLLQFLLQEKSTCVITSISKIGKTHVLDTWKFTTILKLNYDKLLYKMIYWWE